MRGWWLFAILIACGDAGRANECDELAAMLKPVGDMPPRYDEWSKLGTHDWQNPDVRAAVKAFVWPSRTGSRVRIDTGWTLYTPYTVAPRDDAFNEAFSYRRQPGRFAALHAVCPAISND